VEVVLRRRTDGGHVVPARRTVAEDGEVRRRRWLRGKVAPGRRRRLFPRAGTVMR
jgi:hypothetical protein